MFISWTATRTFLASASVCIWIEACWVWSSGSLEIKDKRTTVPKLLTDFGLNIPKVRFKLIGSNLRPYVFNMKKSFIKFTVSVS
jgi:hypothetical protein